MTPPGPRRRAAAPGIGLRLIAGEVRFNTPRTAEAKRALADLRHREAVRKFLLTEAVEIMSSPRLAERVHERRRTGA